MTRRRLRTPLDRPDPLSEAIAAYSVAFSKAGLPLLRGAGGFEARRVAARMLRRAVATGQPLGEWDVMNALGHKRPPEDACW